MTGSRGPTELVDWAFDGTLDSGTTVDMAAVILGEGRTRARLSAVMDDDAEVTFATPDGAFMGAMGGPFRGAEGLRRGWAEWLEPWESFTFRATELLETPNGDALVLGQCPWPFGGLRARGGHRCRRALHGRRRADHADRALP